MLIKFSDAAKLSGVVRTLGEKNQVEDWVQVDKMKFNRGKCIVQHLGNKNQLYNYSEGETWLGGITGEKDLGLQ